MSSASLASDKDAIALASELLVAGDLVTARKICSGALRASPGAPEVLHVLGLTLARAGDMEQAAGILTEAIRNKPGQGEWYCDIGTVYAAGGEWVKAASAFQQAHELIPGDAHNLRSYEQVLPRIADALWQSGDVTAFRQTLKQLSDAGISASATESFRLSALLHDASHTAESILEAHRAWGLKFFPATRSTEHAAFTNSLDTERPLRVGYLTGEFRCCPGYHFLIPLLRGHDRKSVETFCYSTCKRMDSCGRSIQALGHCWRDVHHLDNAALDQLIRCDEIDILVDFSGHFDGHRLGALANRMAPVQVFYPNYPATSGLVNVDYVLTDRWLCPPGHESNYSETVYRVPSGCIVYAPPGYVAIRDLPARANGFVTFGLFQRPQKISSVCWDAIGAVLRAVPDSRLLIQYDSALHPKFVSELEARGVEGKRLDVRDWLPIRERVLLLGEVDIALDSFPYNGQTTTCECLWMGVPVVTRSGQSHVSRVAGSILHQVGLSEWIADSQEEYVAIASRFARDVDGLAKLRTGLRQRVAASPLVDAQGKAREIEQAYREMWRTWVQAGSKLPTLNAA